MHRALVRLRRLVWQLARPGAHRLLFLALSAVLAACSTPPPQGGHQFTVSEEDGIRVARNSGGPKYEGELFSYEKVLEILPDDSRPETLFAFPTSGDVDEDGNLYVADPNNNRIAMFDAAGKWLRNIGRQGEGPGEYQFPSEVYYQDGLVYIPDLRRRGVNVFRPDGEFIEFKGWPEFGRVGSLVPEVWTTPTGGWVVRLVASSREVARAENRDPGTDVSERAEMVVFDEEGTEMVRVTSDWIKTGEYRTYEAGGRERTSQVPVYFAARPRGGYVPGTGIWTATGAEPTFRWFDLDGNPNGRWEVGLPPVPVTDEDRAVVEANLRQQLRDAVNPPDGRPRPNVDRLRLLTENLLFADKKAYWETPLADDGGFFWMPAGPIDRTSGQPPETISLMVISPEGEYLGTTTPPALGMVRHGHLFAIATDPETEERYPVVYRIRPAVEGVEYR